MDYPTAEAALRTSFAEVAPGLDEPTVTRLARTACNTLHAMGRLTPEPADAAPPAEPHAEPKHAAAAKK